MIKLTDENLMRLGTNNHRQGHVYLFVLTFIICVSPYHRRNNRGPNYLNIVGKIQINTRTQYGKIHYKVLVVLGHLNIKIPTYHLFKHRRIIMFLPL